MPMADEEIVAAALRGRPQDFEELVRRYADRIYRFCCRQVGDAEEARDLSQETWWQAYKSLANFRRERKFSSWLFGVAARVCAGWHRKRRNRANESGADACDRATSELSSPQTSPSQAAEREILKSDVRQAVAALPSNYRSVVVMRYLEDFSCAEIGEALGLSKACVAKRLTRALRILEPRLEEWG